MTTVAAPGRSDAAPVLVLHPAVSLSLHPQGDFAPQNMMRAIARQVCENLLSGEQDRRLGSRRPHSPLTAPSDLPLQHK